MKTKSKLSFKALLKETGRTKYVNDEVVTLVEPCEPQELEFFTLGKYVTESELDAAYRSRGLEAAHPYALALYAKDHPEFADDKPIGTHWQDKDGRWCFATFDGCDDERSVHVLRFDEWDDDWWFAGLRKSSGLPSSELSAPLALDLSAAIERVKAAGYQVSKIV